MLYEQREGAAMGSPVVANLYMEFFEDLSQHPPGLGCGSGMCSLVPRREREGPGTHCMRMRLIAVTSLVYFRKTPLL